MNYAYLAEKLLEFDRAMGSCDEIGCPGLCGTEEDCVIYQAFYALCACETQLKLERKMRLDAEARAGKAEMMRDEYKAALQNWHEDE